MIVALDCLFWLFTLFVFISAFLRQLSVLWCAVVNCQAGPVMRSATVLVNIDEWLNQGTLWSSMGHQLSLLDPWALSPRCQILWPSDSHRCVAISPSTIALVPGLD
jgi:hypothetical protein